MLKFMKNKILIPLLVIGALAAFFSFKYGEGGGQSDEERKTLILESVMKAINHVHYSPRDINDSFSKRVYTKILDELDYDKKLFTVQDISALKKYQYQIDDEIRNGSIDFYEKLDAIFVKRINDADTLYKEILKTPYTFTGKEKVELNGEKLSYAANEAALKDRWREFLKYRVLAKYVELKDARDKKKDDNDTTQPKEAVKDEKPKTDAELEADARESVRKNQQAYFKRLHKWKEEERYEYYVNAVVHNEDPHTDYFAPKEKKRFDESMSGTFYGIGAQLKDDNGKIKITLIVTGSPCWKQGELKAGDEITKVAQGDKEPEDIQGYEIDDVVSKIRGPKGTEVRLTVKKVDGSVKVIPIIRGEVLLEETFAKSAIIKSTEGPVGYIYLPEFYADFQGINGRRCADDIAIEVQKLKSAGVKGIILDLRYNGGGSLNDVVDMAGLFVGRGPVVQVKSSSESPKTLVSSKDAIYDGPMAIMVNQGSASASEIMAAAMQDYKRAVIVGSTTYGKGTVQKVIPLDDWIDPVTRAKMQTESLASAQHGMNSIGALKITIQKFYRINGGSTQLKGVTPDVELPDPYSLLENGERHDKAALPWDEIPRSNYRPVTNAVNTADLSALSKSRIAANPTFSFIKESALKLKKQQEDNIVSLNEAEYRKEMEETNATSKKLEELQKKLTPYEITNPKEDQERINADSASITKNKEWLKNLKKDIYVSETVNIINDIAKSGMHVETGMK